MLKTIIVKFSLVITFTILLSGALFSQDIPKLWKDFRNGSPAQRVKACDELTRYYHSEAHDSLRVLGEELFLYGIDEHYYPAIEQGKLTLSDYFIFTGKTADGITMAKALLSNMEERGDDRMLSTAAGTISLGYVLQKDGKSANYWAKRASKAAANNPDPIIRAESLMALAESWYLLEQKDKALQTYQQYIKMIKPEKKYRSLSAAYGRMGDIYRLDGKMDLAEKFFNYSMKNARLSGMSISLAHAINNQAIVYFENGDTTNARKLFEEALQLRLKVNDPKAISESYYNIGDYHFYTSQYESAAFWYRRSFEYAKENKLKPEQADALRALAQLAKSQGDFKGSTAYLENYLDLEAQIKVQNSADDEEITNLQRTIMRLETENDVNSAGFGMKRAETHFMWEWLVIAFLGTVVVMSLFMKRKSG